MKAGALLGVVAGFGLMASAAMAISGWGDTYSEPAGTAATIRAPLNPANRRRERVRHGFGQRRRGSGEPRSCGSDAYARRHPLGQ